MLFLIEVLLNDNTGGFLSSPEDGMDYVDQDEAHTFDASEVTDVIETLTGDEVKITLHIC